MELRARLHPLTEASRARLLEVLSPAPAPTSDRYPVSVEDSALPRILAAGEAAGGYWVSGEAVLDAGELASVSHFEAVCRLLARETEADRERNTATVRAAPERDAGGFAPIRLVRGFVLSRPRLRPNQVAALFRTSHLRGWAFRPVLAEGTELHAQYLAQWRRLRSLVPGTASSRLDGGRW